ncbi:SGNH/GDSL hydrolase family protein [Pseudoduganella namucuonensis]|uniref:Phospholipase/lecithinase/hemolysin n=1 Tax=Pseudoduganella namucuonensis TaxID=1035707 RepID=A0A1I7KKP9_9BURK|nr:SGNH/GDSL hydrolase family protein [Pseudoduganella namucuonensis]SFU98012.1 Phospholipase/lecithinase/hemolysin [Pseudoduganella namucuonensis]
MRYTKLALAVMSAAILAACGSGKPNGGDQTLKVKFASQVSFGDSLSDVGTYAVGTVKALGGGKYTINGNNTGVNAELTGKNWTELMAAQFGLPAPCAAMTGLDGDAARGFKVPVTNNAGCYGYAQGGARVTNPVGPGNKLTGSALGQLTVPVVQQVKNHLAAVGGKFKGDEIVFVMAGGNDVLFNLGALSSGATAAGTAAGATAFATSLVGQLAAGAPNPQTAAQAIGLALATEAANPAKTDASVVAAAVTAAVKAGNTAVASLAVYGPMVAKAQADGTAAGTKAGTDYAAAEGPKLVVAMAAAGRELAAIVKNQIVANGAKYVTVNNLPDVSITPSALAQPASTQQLIAAMVKAFNDELTAGLNGVSNVLIVDVYYVSHDQATNPGPYGLTNVKEAACDLSAAKNPLGSSLTCNASNLKSGDVSHYAFADDVHPTPFNNWLLARYVSEKMVVKGWL